MISRPLISSALLTLSMSVFALPVPALAAGGTQDAYGSRSGVGAGIYLRLPFVGGLRKAHADGFLKYGLRMGFTRNFRASSPFHGDHRRIDIDMLTMRFGTMGFENLSIAGHEVIKYSTTALGANGSKTNWTNLGIGVIVAGATVAVAVLASTNNTVPATN